MFMSARQVAELLNVSEFTVYRLAKKKELPSYTIGGQIRFDHEELLKHIKEGAKKV